MVIQTPVSILNDVLNRADQAHHKNYQLTSEIPQFNDRASYKYTIIFILYF